MPKSAPKSADPKDCLWGAWESWSSCEHMDEHLGVGKFWSWTGRPMRRHSGVPFVNLPNATDLGRSLERSQVNTNGVFRFAFAIEAFDALHFPFASLFIFGPGIPVSLFPSVSLRCALFCGGPCEWIHFARILVDAKGGGKACIGSLPALAALDAVDFCLVVFFAMEIMEQDLGMRQSHVSRRMPLTVSSLNGLSIAALFIRSLCGIYIECKPRACILPEKVSPHWSWLWQCWYGQIFQISLSTVGLSHQLSSLSALDWSWQVDYLQQELWRGLAGKHLVARNHGHISEKAHRVSEARGVLDAWFVVTWFIFRGTYAARHARRQVWWQTLRSCLAPKSSGHSLEDRFVASLSAHGKRCTGQCSK